MNTSDAAQRWQQILNTIQAEIPETSFNTWFLSLKFLQVQNSQLIVEAPTVFIRNILTSRYTNMLNNAAAMHSNGKYSVRLVIANEINLQEADNVPAAEAIVAPSNMLNPQYTFESFVVGASNRFAHAASLAVAEQPADAYNPLFLYGGVGLGKTHLMHAIGHFIHQQNPNTKLLYITSENFTNELITAIAKKTNQEMRDRFRNVDVLMVDDIQFIAGKTSTQEEFFHTFNQLHSSGKQIIISSDRPPKEIPTLEERLRSRFEWGLIADIQKPDYETRVAILRKKAESERIAVDDEVLHFIAEKIESNIRELEGAFIRVTAFSSLTGSEISVRLAEEALKNILMVRDPKRTTPEMIMQVVAKHYQLTEADMLSGRRNQEIALPRQIAMYLSRELTNLSTPRIGSAFGGRDHTTVIHACKKISKLLESDKNLSDTIDQLTESIHQQ